MTGKPHIRLHCTTLYCSRGDLLWYAETTINGLRISSLYHFHIFKCFNDLYRRVKNLPVFGE